MKRGILPMMNELWFRVLQWMHGAVADPVHPIPTRLDDLGREALP